MMSGLPFGMLVEGSVSVLLAVTIGYCVVLNHRLKRLHADRGELRQMVADLVQATDLAQKGVGELRQAATEADLALAARLEEAERFGIELANHVSAGQEVLGRIARITAVAQQSRQPAPEPPPPEVPSRLQAALQQLAERERIRSDAA
jgi:hypothetical protein